MNLSRTIIMFFGVILFGLSGVFAQQVGAPSIKADFQKIDTNKDGFITSDELQAHQTKQFNKLDKNKNGIIEKSELKDDESKMFEKADKNNDNQISQKEAFENFNDYFNSMDADKDRRVSESEFEQYWPINLRF